MALVLFVIRFSTDLGHINPVKGSVSAHITLAPVWAIAVFVGYAVNAVEITSSLGPTFARIKDK